MNNKNHYSYRIYSDTQTAKDFDADRFGDSIGELIKRNQEQMVFFFLPGVKGWKVIDIGAGTGRFVIPFLKLGAEVTACDASRQMLEVLREKTIDPNLHVFVTDAHNLHFTDQTFDCVLSFRMLLHVLDWKKALSELCRMSRDWVIIDFPPWHGFLLFTPLWHRIRQIFSENVQTYRVLSIKDVIEELQKNGFEVVTMDHGFFLPFVVHRTIGSTRFMAASEKLFSNTGLTKIAGSPITLFARRRK